MKAFVRCTVVVSCPTAADAARVTLAREGCIGTSVTMIDGLAARLAGGFYSGIDGDLLHDSVLAAVSEVNRAELGDLGAISGLPGFASALCTTLIKSWSAGIDLSGRAATKASMRLAALSQIESAAIAKLPPSCRRPTDLVAEALDRLRHAPAAVGEVEFRAVPDLDPCWRPLVIALARTVRVRWLAGPRPVPSWVRAANIAVETAPKRSPAIAAASCANARHEAIEAMRWARSLLADGVSASDIAISAGAPGEYDDLLLAFADEANLDLHFAHGRPVLMTREGQACAALADLLLHGIDRTRIVRLVRAVRGTATPLGALSPDWRGFVPVGSNLDTPERWGRVLASTEAPPGISKALMAAVEQLAQGLPSAREAGETLLRGPPRAIWRRALSRAPASALETTLAGLRSGDFVEPATSIAWMPAAALAAAPRPYVWLLGLNSRMWPRRSREDPLLPDDIVPASEFEPRTITTEDRASLQAILDTSAGSVTLSFSRRDATGRLLGKSTVLPKVAPTELHRARVPEHAFSEPDRLMACPHDFAGTSQAVSADTCWQDWHRPGLTMHDGLVRPNHPAITSALARDHSASSLRLLLRNPLGFVWRYALGWREPDLDEATFDLDAATFGSLVHDILEAAVVDLEAKRGLAGAKHAAINAAVERASRSVADAWVKQTILPPTLLWEAHLARARQMASQALAWPLPPFPGQRSHVEISFPDAGEGSPWKGSKVPIPNTSFCIAGRIDRLDISADGKRARVIDYKTGGVRDPVELDGGKELQRCLYQYAVRALLGQHVKVEAALLYPRDEAGGYRPLTSADESLRTLTRALAAAERSLRSGNAVLGPDTGGDYDDLLFALPVIPGLGIEEKREASRRQLGKAASIWDEP